MRIVIHVDCGGVVGETLAEPGDYPRAADFTRVDGTHLEPFSPLREECPRCGVIIQDFRKLELKK